MLKEFLLIGLFIVVTVSGIGGAALSWRIAVRVKRGVAILSLMAIYLLVSYLIARWVGSGGWPEGMIAIPIVVVVALPVALGMFIGAVFALFTGGKPNVLKKIMLVTILSLVGIILLGLAFNKPIRTEWYLRDVENPDPVKRRLAVIMVGKYGSSKGNSKGSAKVLPVLLKAVEDEDSGVRESAVFGMMNLGDSGATPAILKALKDESPNVRRAAAYCIVPVGRGEPWLLGVLLPLIHDPDESVREAVVSGLDAVDANWRKGLNVPPQY
jgi:HEAT repeats